MNKYLLLISTLMVSCAAQLGNNFAPPTEVKLRLRETTVEQARAIYGKPAFESSSTLTQQEIASLKASGQLTTLVYTFIDRSVPPARSGLAGWKRMELTFWNDKLVRYSFKSTYKTDSTLFDGTKVAQIIRGKSTQAEVEALLGKPKGAAVFPWIKAEDRTAALYEAIEFDYANNLSRSQYLRVEYDKANIVQDYDYQSTTKPWYGIAIPQ